MQYIQSVQTVEWKLTLRATEMLLKYYDAHDKHTCAKLIVLYLTDMDSQSHSDPYDYC